MNNYDFYVNFSTGTIYHDDFVLVVNDHNSTKFKFTYNEQEGRKVFKLLYPDNTIWVQDITNDEIILTSGVLNQEGRYSFEVALYGEDSRLTSARTSEFYVRKELVETDEIVEVDDRVPVLDALIEDVNGILEEVSDGAFDGATFTPSVDEEGNLSWTNNKALENPETVNVKGPRGFVGQTGQNGADGTDGYSPIVEISKIDNISTINITDKNGTHSTQIIDGTNGSNGKDGEDGQPGLDGFSPIVNITKTDNISTISITDKDGTKMTEIKDGIDGVNGIDGQPGRDGYMQYEAGENISIIDNVISASSGNGITVLEGDEIVLADLEPGVYLTNGISKLQYGKNGAGYLFGDSNYLLFVETYVKSIKVAYVITYNGYIHVFNYNNSKRYEYLLSSFVTSNNVLVKTNTTSFTPTSDYHPSTKKYVDDSVVNKQNILTAGDNITIDENNVISANGGSSNDMIFYWRKGMSSDEIKQVFQQAVDNNKLGKNVYVNFVPADGTTSTNVDTEYVCYYCPTTITDEMTSVRFYAPDVYRLSSNKYTDYYQLNNMLYKMSVKVYLNQGIVTTISREVGQTNANSLSVLQNYALKSYVDDQVGNINTVLATLTTPSEVSE